MLGEPAWLLGNPLRGAHVTTFTAGSLPQERKREQILGFLHALVPKRDENLAQRVYRGELVTVSYDKLYAITSCVAREQELVAYAQKHITELETRLTRLLRPEPD